MTGVDTPEDTQQQGETQVEDGFHGQRPTRRVHTEVGEVAGHPHLDHEQVGEGDMGGGVGTREQQHGQCPGDHVVRVDLDEPAPPEPRRGVAAPRRPGQYESAEHEEERHTKAAGLRGPVGQAVLRTVVGQQPQRGYREEGVVGEDGQRGGEPQAGEGGQPGDAGGGCGSGGFAALVGRRGAGQYLLGGHGISFLECRPAAARSLYSRACCMARSRVVVGLSSVRAVVRSTQPARPRSLVVSVRRGS